LEVVLLDIFLQIALTILEEEIEVVIGFFNIEKLYDVRMLQALQCSVFFLHSFDEIFETGLQYFFDILLLNNLAGERFVKVFIFIGLIRGCKSSPAETLIHFDEVVSNFLVLLFHINNINLSAISNS
jgi:hypothetical protein